MSDTPSLSPAARLGQLIEKWRLFAEETVLRNGDDRLRKGVWMVVADDLADLLPAVQALEQEQETAWLLIERQKSGKERNVGIALTQADGARWVQSPDMEFGEARSSLPLKIERARRAEPPQG